MFGVLLPPPSQSRAHPESRPQPRAPAMALSVPMAFLLGAVRKWNLNICASLSSVLRVHRTVTCVGVPSSLRTMDGH